MAQLPLSILIDSGLRMDPAPLLVVPPTPPDFLFCHPRLNGDYSFNLKDCQAAEAQMPRGTEARVVGDDSSRSWTSG